jgi:hypothetical protein
MSGRRQNSAADAPFGPLWLELTYLRDFADNFEHRFGLQPELLGDAFDHPVANVGRRPRREGNLRYRLIGLRRGF